MAFFILLAAVHYQHMRTVTLEQHILDTLAYFAMFSHPLTPEELGQYLYKSAANMSELWMAIQSLESKGSICYAQGYVQLASIDIDMSIACRQQRWWYSKQRLDIAMRAAKKLRYIPFIQAIFVCNQLTVTAHERSDIDVFVVVKHGRMWLTRLLITLWLSVWGMRRHGEQVNKHICLSFFSSDYALSLSDVAIEEDIYLAYWIALLIPIFDEENIYKLVWQKNKWMHSVVPGYRPQYIPERYGVKSTTYSRAIKKVFQLVCSGKLGDILERYAKKIQRAKMLRNKTSKQHQGTSDVIISDHMLKFHENDRRAQYRDQWKTLAHRYF